MSLKSSRATASPRRSGRISKRGPVAGVNGTAMVSLG